MSKKNKRIRIAEDYHFCLRTAGLIIAYRKNLISTEEFLSFLNSDNFEKSLMNTSDDYFLSLLVNLKTKLTLMSQQKNKAENYHVKNKEFDLTCQKIEDLVPCFADLFRFNEEI